MKNLIVISLLLLCQIVLSNVVDSTKTLKPKVIPILEAMDKGMLQLKISGAADQRIFEEFVDKEGVHYGKCMAIILKSNIDSIVLLKLECGRLLIPTGDSVQIMMITKDAEIPLFPNETYATRFYAMCTQIHFRAPDVSTTYRIGDMADSASVKLAKYIESSYNQNMIGQHALWAFTDKVNFHELKKYGADSSSISKSITILNAVGLKTSINPVSHCNIKPTVSLDFTINRYWVYGGIGVIVLLVGAIVFLLLSKDKDSEIIV